MHCHIVYGIDDGSDSSETSFEMGRIAVGSGITDIIATPHCMPGRFENYCGAEFDAAFSALKATLGDSASASRLRIHRGMEVFADSSTIELFEHGKLCCLSRSNYMLVECAFDEDPIFFRDLLARLIRRGIRPIVAHPERYYFAHDDTKYLYELLDMGCALQLDTDSITGAFGNSCHRVAHELLSNGAAQLAASDAHDAYSRVPDMRDAARLIAYDYSSNYAELLFDENPARILQNRSLRFRGDGRGSTPAKPSNRFMTDEEYWGI